MLRNADYNFIFVELICAVRNLSRCMVTGRQGAMVNADRANLLLRALWERELASFRSEQARILNHYRLCERERLSDA